jgi:hypothetical protein
MNPEGYSQLHHARLLLVRLRALNNGAGESMANFTHTAHPSTITFVREEHADYPGLALTTNMTISRSSRVIKALLPECLTTTSREREHYTVVLELQTSCSQRPVTRYLATERYIAEPQRRIVCLYCTSQLIQEMLTHKQNCTATISEGKVIKLVAPEWSVDGWH